MALPKVSKKGSKLIRDAAKSGAVMANQRSRVIQLAEAITRQNRAKGREPSEVQVKVVPDGSIAEALMLLAGGGIYESIRLAGKERNKTEVDRLEELSAIRATQCEAYSCTVVPVCRGRDGRIKGQFGPASCSPPRSFRCQTPATS